MSRILDCAGCGYPLVCRFGRLTCDCPLNPDVLGDSTFPPCKESFLKDKEKATRKMALAPKPWDTQRPSGGTIISIIVCMSENRVIGRGGDLPWHLPKDMQRFRKITMGNPIVMGRKTHESIGKVLPGRKNIVLSRKLDYLSPGCITANKLSDVQVSTRNADEVFVIGGESIYRLFLPACFRIYLTTVHTELEGDTFFPDFDRTKWVRTERELVSKDDYHKWDMTFSVWERI